MVGLLARVGSAGMTAFETDFECKKQERGIPHSACGSGTWARDGVKHFLDFMKRRMVLCLKMRRRLATTCLLPPESALGLVAG